MTKRATQPPAPARHDAETAFSERRRGRGACSNAAGRYEGERRDVFDDGWESLCELDAFRTEVREETARSIIATNDSPDIGFDQSINAYRGCEHGCIYCFARPTHCHLGYSAGIDFETKLTAKINAAELLEKALANPRYQVKPIMLGTNTDPYQPIERERRITRAILEVLERARHPVGIVTKSALVTRDLDILAPMAEQGLVNVAISVTTLDNRLSRVMEPRASAPMKRLEAIRALSEAGVPTRVMAAPMIPALNDAEMERIMQAAAGRGAQAASYILLRLPLEVAPLFREWLAQNYPDRASRVMSLIQDMRGGKDYDSRFGVRKRGEGPYAQALAARFAIARRRFGLTREHPPLRTGLFRPPRPRDQFDLFAEP
ncbi:MAG: PA0069 family radical SAM protein [Dichotomicrobium sp.]